ncbi:acyl-CoA thioesterase [Natronospirillum operosum]|uniref:Acyl-CoA thioesterase n=2 Tax=Natronospirillum operosum TaxID=2759953 RepID=A0A4Z0W2R3_9GAMM|nr:acyl-CoA thioesterase [Natronospirillum operosum]
MLTNRVNRTIEWGDCDPAGIVFYPRYFAFFDDATGQLFAAAGFPKYEMTQRFDIVGIPMVDTRSKFYIPSRYGDEVVIESTVTEFRRSSFDVTHRLYKGEALAVEGFETRVWVRSAPERPGGIQAQAIPEEVLGAFAG